MTIRKSPLDSPSPFSQRTKTNSGPPPKGGKARHSFFDRMVQKFFRKTADRTMHQKIGVSSSGTAVRSSRHPDSVPKVTNLHMN